MKKQQTKQSLSLESFKVSKLKKGNNILGGGEEDEGTATILTTKKPKTIRE